MSQRNPKLPQLDIAVHGFGYLEENYGKRNFGFSEILPKVDISDGICDAFRILFRILFRISILETICDLFRMLSRIFTVCSMRKLFLMYLWSTSDFPKWWSLLT